MRKIPPEQFNGLQFVRLSSLPFHQMIRLKDWLGEEELISIPHRNGIIRNCVTYEGYEFWFDVVRGNDQYEEISLF